VIATRAPSRASRRALANPMPSALPHPVTSATRPLNSNGFSPMGRAMLSVHEPRQASRGGAYDLAVSNRLDDDQNRSSTERITPTIPTISRIEPTV
jgi:hypothetical protein